MDKEDVKPDAPAAKEPKPKPVMQEEFNEFKDEVNTKIDAGFSMLLDQMKQLSVQAPAPAPQPSPVVAKEGGPDSGDAVPVPPSWHQMKDLILGPDFTGIREDMPSGEIKYSIIVPREKSNADALHWNNFKIDKRTIVVKNGERSVKEGLIKIRNNLIASGKQLVQYP